MIYNECKIGLVHITRFDYRIRNRQGCTGTDTRIEFDTIQICGCTKIGGKKT